MRIRTYKHINIISAWWFFLSRLSCTFSDTKDFGSIHFLGYEVFRWTSLSPFPGFQEAFFLRINAWWNYMKKVLNFKFGCKNMILDMFWVIGIRNLNEGLIMYLCVTIFHLNLLVILSDCASTFICIMISQCGIHHF